MGHDNAIESTLAHTSANIFPDPRHRARLVEMRPLP